jgi:hypothetical protein
MKAKYIYKIHNLHFCEDKRSNMAASTGILYISILHRIPQRPLNILNCSLYCYSFVHIPCICDVDNKSMIRRRPLPMKIFHSYWIQTMDKYSLDNTLCMTEWVAQGHMNISFYFRIFEKTLNCMKSEVKRRCFAPNIEICVSINVISEL